MSPNEHVPHIKVGDLHPGIEPGTYCLSVNVSAKATEESAQTTQLRATTLVILELDSEERVRRL